MQGCSGPHPGAKDAYRALHHALLVKLQEACSACGLREPSSPKHYRYRTCGWLLERLQGCLSGNSQHGWWVLWDDSLHTEALIDWAEKLLDDMGRRAQKRLSKVRLQ